MPESSVYKVPDDLPSHLREFLAERSIQPGDYLCHYTEGDVPLLLHRELDAESAKELAFILPHLKHIGGPEFKRSEGGEEGWYSRKEK